MEITEVDIMNESVLTSIKKMLGIVDGYDYFDQDVIMHINTVFMILNQLGVGPTDHTFRITGYDETWSDFSENIEDMEAVKSYMYLKVRQLFDPPTNGTVAESINRSVTEMEERLRYQTCRR